MRQNKVRFWGQSSDITRVLHAARMVAMTEAPVLILGERGAGKEMLAREIHAAGHRRAQPFLTLRARELDAAGWRGLMGADESVRQGGCLFIDDVLELDPAVQEALAAYLDRQAEHDAPAPLRVLAATREDPARAMDAGRFSADLFYRLNVVPLEVPPLRERKDDIVFLLKALLAESARRRGRKAPSLTPTARHLLKTHAWPGNLRELQNICDRLVILYSGQKIQAEHLPREVTEPAARAGQAGFVLPKDGIHLPSLEAEVIRQAVAVTGGNRSRAARLLGITRDTLLYRMRKHAIS